MAELLASWWGAGFIGKITLLVAALYAAAICGVGLGTSIVWCVEWIDQRLAKSFKKSATIKKRWVAIPCAGEEEYQSVEDNEEVRQCEYVRFFVEAEVPFIGLCFIEMVSEQMFDQLKEGSRATVQYTIGALSRRPKIYSLELL